MNSIGCRISNSTWQSLDPLICRLLLYSKGLWPKDLTKLPKRCQEYVWLESVESHRRLRTITYHQSSSYIWIYVVYVHTTDSHHPKRAWDHSQKSFQKTNHLETHFWKRNTLFVHGVMGGYVYDLSIQLNNPATTIQPVLQIALVQILQEAFSRT